MQFSLKWMLAAVAFVGFGCTALYNANETWAMATMAITIIGLLVAVLAAVYAQPRAFYVGMCLFGWSYLVLTYGPTMRDSVRPLAVTDGILDLVYEVVKRDSPPAFVGQPNIPVPRNRYFQPVGHSLFALIFAFIGGVVGNWFSRGAKCNSH